MGSNGYCCQQTISVSWFELAQSQPIRLHDAILVLLLVLLAELRCGRAASRRAMSSTQSKGPNVPEGGAADAKATEIVRSPSAPPVQSGLFYKRVLPCPPAIEFSSQEGRSQQQASTKAADWGTDSTDST